LNSASAISIAREFAEIRNEMELLQKKAKTIEEIDSKIDIANVLAEISFLVDKKTVLSKVEFVAERFGDKQEEKPNNRSAVRGVSDNEPPLLGDVRFKVLISGVAPDASGVAALICKLEDSPYFYQVTPLFTRNREMKTAAKAGERTFQMSEFEISCNLANYRQGEYFAEGARKGKAAGL
jgi:hypothetical protein